MEGSERIFETGHNSTPAHTCLVRHGSASRGLEVYFFLFLLLSHSNSLLLLSFSLDIRLTKPFVSLSQSKRHVSRFKVLFSYAGEFDFNQINKKHRCHQCFRSHTKKSTRFKQGSRVTPVRCPCFPPFLSYQRQHCQVPVAELPCDDDEYVSATVNFRASKIPHSKNASEHQ